MVACCCDTTASVDISYTTDPRSACATIAAQRRPFSQAAASQYDAKSSMAQRAGDREDRRRWPDAMKPPTGTELLAILSLLLQSAMPIN